MIRAYHVATVMAPSPQTCLVTKRGLNFQSAMGVCGSGGMGVCGSGGMGVVVCEYVGNVCVCVCEVSLSEYWRDIEVTLFSITYI